MKDNQTNTPKRDYKLMAEEASLTVVVLGFIISGLLGGAHLVGHIDLPEAWQRAIGGALVAYVLVGTMLAVHFGIKFLMTRK